MLSFASSLVYDPSERDITTPSEPSRPSDAHLKNETLASIKFLLAFYAISNMREDSASTRLIFLAECWKYSRQNPLH